MRQFKSLRLVRQHPFVKHYVIVTLLIFIIFFLISLLPWQQNVEAKGFLISFNPLERPYKITAPVNGFIDDYAVTENQFVKKGDKLFKMKDLDSDYQTHLISIKEQSIQKYNNELKKLELSKQNLLKQKEVFKITNDIYDKKINQINNSLAALVDQKIALENKNRIEHIQYKRSVSLHKDGIESKRDLELNESNYLHTKAQVRQIVTKTENMKQDLDITKEEKTRFDNETTIEINRLKNNIISSQNMANSLQQNIEQESITLSRYLSSYVYAKSAGDILRIYQNDKNRLIKQGTDVLYFSPVVTRRSIRIKVSDFNMPLMKSGLKVRIIFYGWPAMQVAGWPKIAHGTYGGVVSAIEKISHEEGAYYAIVVEDPKDDPWPQKEMLKIGTQATIWVTLSVVPLWYEAWRLIMAQPPEIKNTMLEEFGK